MRRDAIAWSPGLSASAASPVMGTNAIRSCSRTVPVPGIEPAAIAAMVGGARSASSAYPISSFYTSVHSNMGLSPEQWVFDPCRAHFRSHGSRLKLCVMRTGAVGDARGVRAAVRAPIRFSLTTTGD